MKKWILKKDRPPIYGDDGIGSIFVANDEDDIDDKVDDDVKVGVRKDGGGERWRTIREGHDSTFCLTDHSQGEDDGDDDDDDDTDGDGNNDDDDYGEEVGGGLGRGRRPVVSSAGRSLQTAAIGGGGCTLKSQKKMKW